jgi:hypothetical protein
MDRWAWQQLDPWRELRPNLPVGALLCVIHGPTSGRHWEASAAREQLQHAAAAAGVRRRFAPTSSATRTPSRWHTRASRWSWSNASSGTPISVSPRSTSRASIAPRSSTPSTRGPRPRSARPPGSRSSDRSGRRLGPRRPAATPSVGDEQDRLVDIAPSSALPLVRTSPAVSPSGAAGRAISPACPQTRRPRRTPDLREPVAVGSVRELC